MYVVICLLVFLAAYLLNILMITVGYHRGLAHKSVTLGPALRRFVTTRGHWITGIDAKTWVVMHRLHHEHSDTPKDPHSPVNVGVLGVAGEQLRSYERVARGLLKRDAAYVKYARDLDFPVNRQMRSGRWWIPHVVHAVLALALAAGVGWLLGLAYFLGMMSHPVQGGLVNALAHASGGRNFATPDQSRNNHPVAWLVFGEGFQNNHHAYPGSATFSHRWYELDLGYGACVVLERLRLCTIDRRHLIPRPAALRDRRAALPLPAPDEA